MLVVVTSCYRTVFLSFLPGEQQSPLEPKDEFLGFADSIKMEVSSLEVHGCLLISFLTVVTGFTGTVL